jgi:hypothetical protein
LQSIALRKDKSRVHKDSTKFNDKKTNNPIKKWAKD